ncbi:hypothetical protein cyc_08507 [Cyclospora cayetanensis]|uniref:Uncharacterized protein n=1 Tax=Cyclospora cayetanensis TaxID=88456 RepID=A0A1D3CUM5_9EIME|nr:hypothetical protein cyc_08507 [Cyclospora cayetanensis]
MDEIAKGLKSCFRTFVPPPGLALDFSPDERLTPDERISSFFKFLLPEQFIHKPAEQKILETSFVEEPAEGEVTRVEPLRSVRYAADSKHILAGIIKNTHDHFKGQACRQVAKRLDGLRRIVLRKNSKAAAFEPLLVFALLQGNVASASTLENGTSHKSMGSSARNELYSAFSSVIPANLSSNPGVYDPAMIVAYFDLVRTSQTTQMKRLEKLLRKSVDESNVGTKLFGNSLANPLTHQKITAVGNAVLSDESGLERMVERIGYMAIDSADAVSILMPEFPNIANFVRGVSFFAFESVFKQNGPYVMPGLPCGGNLSGNMLEALTEKKLGTTYFVYKYTKPVVATTLLPESVWMPQAGSELATYLQEHHSSKGDYLLAHAPRVCVRKALYEKCSKVEPAKLETAEQQLCLFIHTHPGLFFKVEGETHCELSVFSVFDLVL